MSLSKFQVIVATVAVVVVQALILYMVGSSLICPCGFVKFWDGAILSMQNSQHLFDWYSASHLVWGFVLYLFFFLVRKKYDLPLGMVFLLVVVLSVGWEMFENTHYGINQLQQSVVSFDYYGDSVINSVVDTLCSIVGFWMAYYLPVWLIVTIAVVLEIVVAANIHDGLVLSAVMFLHPVYFIAMWQKAALISH